MTTNIDRDDDVDITDGDTEWVPAFDPTLYPRTYRVSLKWKLLLFAFGLPLAVGGFLAAGWFLLDNTLAGWAAVFLAALCAALAGLGGYGSLHALQYRVVLTADAIEVIGPLRRRRYLRREEIKGRQLISSPQGISTLVFVPGSERAKKLGIPLVLKTDEAFHRWYFDMPDVDAQEFVDSEERLARDRYLDLSPEDTAARTARLRRLVTGVNSAAIVLSAGYLFSPIDPAHLLFASLLALPWFAIGLVARFQPLYRFGGRSSDWHPDLSLALITPGLILALRTLAAIETLGWRGPATLACIGGLGLAGAAARVDPWLRKQRWEVLVAGLITCSYGYGAGLELNSLADRSIPRVFPTVVVEKRVDGDWKWRTWYLTLKPWGPVTENDEVSVSKALYEQMQPGEAVCVLLRSGAFRIPWYEIASCRKVDP
jgi:hypothetical protein